MYNRCMYGRPRRQWIFEQANESNVSQNDNEY